MEGNVDEPDNSNSRAADVQDDVVVEHEDAEEEVEHAPAQEGVQEGGVARNLGRVVVRGGDEFEGDEAGAEAVVSD